MAVWGLSPCRHKKTGFEGKGPRRKGFLSGLPSDRRTASLKSYLIITTFKLYYFFTIFTPSTIYIPAGRDSHSPFIFMPSMV